uniref:Uncharacterized protein n=1 Tax=Pipistrellus kuhlii TaxID=59472 RepID=A0A7J7YXE8_PIPKU|nr:hypothetical protein mPipKuh1_009904 [Pipistrellus kuhlii]
MYQGSRKGRGHSLSSLVNGGARAELGGPCPIASGLQVESSLLTAPHCNLNPKLPTPLASWASLLTPFTGEIVIKWCLSPAPGGTSLPHLTRRDAAGAYGPRNTFMWQGRELGFQLHTQFP